MRLDTTPLRRHRDFRLLFVAGTVFYLGGMVSYVAVPYQLYDLTRSNFAVGALGIAELVFAMSLMVRRGPRSSAVRAPAAAVLPWSSAFRSSPAPTRSRSPGGSMASSTPSKKNCDTA